MPYNHVRTFADSITSSNYADFKKNLQRLGYSPNEIAEIVYQGSLEKGENIWEKSGWGMYLSEISLTNSPVPIAGDVEYHAHHLVQKSPRLPIARDNARILMNAGINVELGRENLFWSPFKAEQIHGTGPQTELNKLLVKAEAGKSGEALKIAIQDALTDWALTVSYRPTP